MRFIRSFASEAQVVMPRQICEAAKAQQGVEQKMFEHAKSTICLTKEESDLWVKFTWIVAMPVTLVTGIWAYKTHQEHLSHFREHPPQFIAYPHMRIMNKKFFFGDGTKTLFHNRTF